jgi:hypothetical protein
MNLKIEDRIAIKKPGMATTKTQHTKAGFDLGQIIGVNGS